MTFLVVRLVCDVLVPVAVGLAVFFTLAWKWRGQPFAPRTQARPTPLPAKQPAQRPRPTPRARGGSG